LSPSLDIFNYSHVSLVLESPELYTALDVESQAEEKGKLPQPNGDALLTAAQVTVGLLYCKGVHVHLVSTKTSKAFLPSFFLAGWPPACTGIWVYFFPGAGLCS